jgi:phage shock protein A
LQNPGRSPDAVEREEVMVELFLLRVLVWVVVPVGLAALVIGPARSWRLLRKAWSWVEDRRHEPAEVLNRVVKEHEKNIRALREVLRQAEAAQADIVRNNRRSEDSITALEQEARNMVRAGDDLGARAALYKLNLERLAIQGFQAQLAQQKGRIDQARRRLHLLELQLRQYEVGRSILLSQLAEAKTVEQQYALANQFDPFSAVAAWVRAEGTVQQATQGARAADQVMQDTADLPLSGQPVRIEPEMLDAQLAELKEQMRRAGGERRS